MLQTMSGNGGDTFLQAGTLHPYSWWYSTRDTMGLGRPRWKYPDEKLKSYLLGCLTVTLILRFELLLILCFKRTTVILKIQFLFCMNCNSYFCDGFWWRCKCKCHKHLQEKLGNIVKICSVQCRLKRLLVVISQLSVAGVSSGDAIPYLRVTRQNTVNISTLSLL